MWYYLKKQTDSEIKKKLLKNAKNFSQINLGSKQKEEVLDVMNMDPFCLFSKMLSF